MNKMKRRSFVQTASLAGFATVFSAREAAGALPEGSSYQTNKESDRQYWMAVMEKMASPVLKNWGEGTLKKNMPLEVAPNWGDRNKSTAYLEATGRLLAGIAPWFTLTEGDSKEIELRKRLQPQALAGLENCVNPGHPDYFLWEKEGQPLVDAAFLAHAFLRAPGALWQPLSKETKERFVAIFKQLRRVNPPYNNWLLFSAMVETFLCSIDEAYDLFRIKIALTKTNEWYVGDGWYADGPQFHFDYYNSFVIQPMLVDITSVLVAKNLAKKEEYEMALKRMQRHADILERFISPEGTFPAFGRSITYRTGVFQPLAQLCLMKQLPEHISPEQVRCALTAVMKRMFSSKAVFSKEGWLQLGFAGHQPDVADSYLNTGSMYLASLVFLPLGLPPTNPFWSGACQEWSSVKAWSGQPFKKDYAVSY
jgi:hypothetical protein